MPTTARRKAASPRRVPAPTLPPLVVNVRLNRLEQIALRSTIDGIPDASGLPFLTEEAAIRFALDVGARVLSAGRIEEFRPMLHTVGGLDPLMTGEA